MKSVVVILFSLLYYNLGISQSQFILNIEQPDFDYISDVIKISDKYYFIQTRLFNDFSDTYSDILVTDETGMLIDSINLNGFDTEYHRILKVDSNEIYLIGSLNSDSCLSKIIISRFNIHSHNLEHLSTYNTCDVEVIRTAIVKGLDQQIFIEATHFVGSGPGVRKKFFRMDSLYSLSLIFENINSVPELSVDFSGKGYVMAAVGLYDFYDANFNFRKQRYTEEFNGLVYNSTHTPFGNHLILEHTIQNNFQNPDPGFQVRLVDSNLVIKKKVVIYPNLSINTEMPLNGGIDIQNANEIWSTGRFFKLPSFEPCVYYITKLDSNLNVVCQHFLGYDSVYRLWGIKGFESGGAIVYGFRVRDGLPLNEGEDIFALRVGENCELPTVSTTDPNYPLVSISAYPNPTINSLTFKVNGFDPATLTVEVFDALGATLFSKENLSYEIKVDDLPSGQYFYRILDRDKILGVGAWVKQ